MVKVGDNVEWRTKKGLLSGKIIGTGSKGKFWKIEKGNKQYFIEKSRVKKDEDFDLFSDSDEKEKKVVKKKETGKAVLYDRNTGSSFKYKTIDEMVKGLNSKYKQYNFSRLTIYQRMEDALKAGREARIEVRKITKEGKQKDKLQVSVSYQKEDGRFQRVGGIFAEKKGK